MFFIFNCGWGDPPRGVAAVVGLTLRKTRARPTEVLEVFAGSRRTAVTDDQVSDLGQQAGLSTFPFLLSLPSSRHRTSVLTLSVFPWSQRKKERDEIRWNERKGEERREREREREREQKGD
jgi:hypothetical protein